MLQRRLTGLLGSECTRPVSFNRGRGRPLLRISAQYSCGLMRDAWSSRGITANFIQRRRFGAVTNPRHFRNSREVSQFYHCRPDGPVRFELRPSCQFRTPSFPRHPRVWPEILRWASPLYSQERSFAIVYFARRGRFYTSAVSFLKTWSETLILELGYSVKIRYRLFLLSSAARKVFWLRQ